MQDYSNYYEMIDKPFFAPEPWVFGVAWGIIYPLMVIAFLYLLYLVIIKKQAPLPLLILYIVNIVANLLFTPLQLGFPEGPWATIDILVILGTLAALMWKAYAHSKLFVLLLVPYLLWGAFATVLQVTIYVINFL